MKPDTTYAPAIGEAIIANATKIGNITIATIPVEFLFVNSAYQRPSQRSVTKIAENFDQNKCGFLAVNYDKSTGGFAIVDGQHRFRAAKMAGIRSLPCQILSLESPEQEAMVFARQDENTVRVTPYERFRARLFAGEPAAKEISRLCEKYNRPLVPRIARYQPGIIAVAQVENIYKKSPECLEWVLNMLCKSNWHPTRISKNILYALSVVYDEVNGNPECENAIIEGIRKIFTPDFDELVRRCYPQMFVKYGAARYIRTLYRTNALPYDPHSAIIAMADSEIEKRVAEKRKTEQALAQALAARRSQNTSASGS